MTRPPLVLWLTLATACSPGSVADGTAVGNATVELATPVGADVESAEGTLRLASLSVRGCEGGADKRVAEGITVSPIASSRLALPTGTWCGIVLEPAGPARWLATTTTERTLDVTLDLGTLEVSTPAFDADDPLDLVLRLAGATPWLGGEALGATEGDVTITPASPAHDGLVARVRREIALFDDADGDRALDRGETVLAGRQPGGDDTDEDDDDTDDDTDEDTAAELEGRPER